jgi:hypothetical protein
MLGPSGTGKSVFLKTADRPAQARPRPHPHRGRRHRGPAPKRQLYEVRKRASPPPAVRQPDDHQHRHPGQTAGGPQPGPVHDGPQRRQLACARGSTPVGSTPLSIHDGKLLWRLEIHGTMTEKCRTDAPVLDGSPLGMQNSRPTWQTCLDRVSLVFALPSICPLTCLKT